MTLGQTNQTSDVKINDYVEPMLRRDWQGFADEILDEVIATYARYGAVCAPTLRIVLEGRLVPSYNIQKGQIECYLPDATTGVGNLHWLYYQNLCGGVDLYDTQAVMESYLPLVIAHEVAHHLRFRYGILAENQWREEEIVQMIAMSLIVEHSRFAALLPQLEFFLYRMVRRLAQIVEKRRQNNSKMLDRRLSPHSMALQELIETSCLGVKYSLTDIILKAGLASDDQLSNEVSNLSTGKCQIDIINYWLAGLIWMQPYFKQRDWQPLNELIDKFILTPSLSRQRASSSLGG